MSRKNIASMNLSSPNLVNVCIDTWRTARYEAECIIIMESSRSGS